MDKEEREEMYGVILILGLIAVTVIAIVAGCLGGCYIVENTKRNYIERGYVEQWNPVWNRMEWVKTGGAE